MPSALQANPPSSIDHKFTQRNLLATWSYCF